MSVHEREEPAPLANTPEIREAHTALTDVILPNLHTMTRTKPFADQLGMATRRLVAECIAHDRLSKSRSPAFPCPKCGEALG